MSANKPFRNLKVVELATVLAGPHVGMFFAELGANVIKIEHPKNRDVTRSWKLKNEDPKSPISAYFSSVNYNKKYLTANLNTSEGIHLVHKELENADVLLVNFKKGSADKLGMNPATIKKKYPQLIIGQISGFCGDDPRAAYDLILQAESGFMSMNGDPNSEPTKMPVALIDILAGHQLKEAILIALLEREKTKRGTFIEVSLYETAVSSLVNQASNWLMAKHLPQRIGSLHPNIAPYGEIFTAKDGQKITFAIGSQQQFENLMGVLDKKELISKEAYANNQNRIIHRMQLKNEMQLVIKNFQSNVIIEKCNKLNVPIGKIKSLDEVFSDSCAKDLILKENIEGIATQRVKSFIAHFDDKL